MDGGVLILCIIIRYMVNVNRNSSHAEIDKFIMISDYIIRLEV
jgi:hypothetical protein